jgi:hypothetical protein
MKPIESRKSRRWIGVYPGLPWVLARKPNAQHQIQNVFTLGGERHLTSWWCALAFCQRDAGAPSYVIPHGAACLQSKPQFLDLDRRVAGPTLAFHIFSCLGMRHPEAYPLTTQRIAPDRRLGSISGELLQMNDGTDNEEPTENLYIASSIARTTFSAPT